LNGDDNFQSPTVKYLRIDDPRLSKSSSVADVNRRERRKPRSYRRRLGPEGIPKIPSGFLRNVPEQLTLIPLTNVRVKTEQAVRYKA
jgi:hypothetical protein